jgi:hypothetical protein
MDDVAGEAAQAEREFSAEVEKSADEDEEGAEDKESAAEFAERIHEKDCRRIKKRSNEGEPERSLVAMLLGMTTLIGSSDQFEAGKEITDFEGGGFRGIGAVSAIVADTGAEVVADGAGGGFLGIGGAHGVAPLEDSAFGFEDQSEYFAGAHEAGEFAEEGALFVYGIEACSFTRSEDHCFDGHNAEAGFVDARENLTLKVARNSVRFDDGESAFYGHEMTPPK